MVIIQFGDIFDFLGSTFGLVIVGIVIIIAVCCIGYQCSDLRDDYRKAKQEKERKQLKEDTM